MTEHTPLSLWVVCYLAVKCGVINAMLLSPHHRPNKSNHPGISLEEKGDVIQ